MFGELENKTVNQYIQEQIKDTDDHEVRGPFPDGSKRLWMIEQGHIYLAIVTPEGEGQCSGKMYSEEQGPFFFDCPLRLLDKAKETNNEIAKDWREQVRAHASNPELH